MESNTGLMELIMRANGFSTRLKELERFGTLKVMFTGVNSKMIWRMVKENILTSMVVNIKESSKMMYKKVTERKNGLMAPNMLEPTKTA